MDKMSKMGKAIQLTPYLRQYIQDKGLKHAEELFQVVARLIDRNGAFLSASELTLPGYAQQEDILDLLTEQGVLSTMSEYYYLNWPKSIHLLLCELGGAEKLIVLNLAEALMCSCPE